MHEMLNDIRLGTDDVNKERAAHGIPQLSVLCWAEEPKYDAAAHQLVWAVLAQDKGGAEETKVVNYNTGKRYQDFVEGTDNVAEYGLAALVGGVAAKKLGLLALIVLVFAKAWKIVLVVAAVAAFKFRKVFKRKGADVAAPVVVEKKDAA